MIRWAGDDPEREGLLGTPDRIVRSYQEFFSGYDEDPIGLLQRTFEETNGYDEIVVLKDIRFESHCEHHIAPIIGKVHVAYLPDKRVVGISKLARVLHGFAERLEEGLAVMLDERLEEGQPQHFAFTFVNARGQIIVNALPEEMAAQK